jgi:hypothetical protein
VSLAGELIGLTRSWRWFDLRAPPSISAGADRRVDDADAVPHQPKPLRRRIVRYLCLIYWDEQKLANFPAAELNALNAAHLDFNDELRRSGHYVEAEALVPSRESRCVRIKQAKPVVTDGPFTEAKEMVAGFYLLEVRDEDEALRIAARIPSAAHATIEVRAVRGLVVEGRS